MLKGGRVVEGFLKTQNMVRIQRLRKNKPVAESFFRAMYFYNKTECGQKNAF